MLKETPLACFDLPGNVGSWVGSSRAGIATAFRWNKSIQFDAGLCIGTSKAKHLFLTHTHADHVQCLCQELLRGESVCNVYFPAQEQDNLVAHLSSFQNLVGDDNEGAPLSIETFFKTKLHPVVKDQEIRIDRTIIVRIVEGTHRRLSYGYSLFQESTKLKPEYEGTPGSELGQLRRQGVEITNAELKPLFCFLGDTRPNVFQDHPEILETHSIVMMESTFIDNISKAIETGHTDWTELQPIMEASPHVLYVLQHFSERYKDAEWETTVKEYNDMTGSSSNAHIMLTDVKCSCSQCKLN